MSSDLFTWASEALERTTFMGLAACRGTLRLALKKAGLDAATLTQQELEVVLLRVLPVELEVRGIEGSMQLCRDIESELAEARFELPGESVRNSTDSTLRRIFG